MKKFLKETLTVIILSAWLVPLLPMPVSADTTLFTETCASNPTQPLNTSTTDGGVNTWSAEIAFVGGNTTTLNSGTANCSVVAATTNVGIAHTMSTAPTASVYYVWANLIDGGTVAATASHGVVVNYIDTSNYYACHYADDAAASTLDVYILKVRGGVGSTLGTASNVASMASGETVECRISYNGTTPTITITNITDAPDTQYLTATDSSSPLTETKKAGVYCGATTARNTDDCATVQDMDEINLFEVSVTAPTVTTQAASSITATKATLNGNITATGGANATIRGFAYGTDSTLATVIATTSVTGTFGTGAFTSSSSPAWTAETSWNSVDIGNFGTADLADLDNDGDSDLMLGDSTTSMVNGYENTGSASSPTWANNNAWDSPNLADWTAPAIADLDNDGDYDMMIGLNAGTVKGYKNTGTASSPTWTAETGWDIADVGAVARPALADLDNDGDFDMMVGENAGIVLGYRNTGTVSSPTWTANTGWNTEDMGASASPTLADLDEDGDFDLMIGEVGGISEGYENTGTASSPTWTAKTSWNTPDVGDWAAPSLADLDDDGDHDLMIEENLGVAKGYENTGQNIILSCNTTYYFRPYATNSTGTGYGAISSSFTTSACPSSPPPTVTTNAETNVGVSLATMNGEITDTGGSNATVRGFAWGTDSTLATVIATTTESGDFGAATFSQNLSGLLSGRTYYFRAYATNPNGTGYGSIDNFTTGTDNTPSRKMRLFESYRIRVLNGRILINQQ